MRTQDQPAESKKSIDISVFSKSIDDTVSSTSLTDRVLLGIL